MGHYAALQRTPITGYRAQAMLICCGRRPSLAPLLIRKSQSQALYQLVSAVTATGTLEVLVLGWPSDAVTLCHHSTETAATNLVLSTFPPPSPGTPQDSVVDYAVSASQLAPPLQSRCRRLVFSPPSPPGHRQSPPPAACARLRPPSPDSRASHGLPLGRKIYRASRPHDFRQHPWSSPAASLLLQATLAVPTPPARPSTFHSWHN